MNTKHSCINFLWSHLIVEELIRSGVDYFCLAPGSRSSPLALAVAQNSKAKSFIHFDERGLGFHALGYTSATKSPCAVITTSGTAVANLFPAIIEASKKKLPLIILTADRPPELRFTGANQTIDQVKIFGDYVRWQFDLPCPTIDIKPEFVLTTIDQLVSQSKSANPPGPVHLNCMYREPLAPTENWDNFSAYLKSIAKWQKTKEPYTKYHIAASALREEGLDEIVEKINQIKSGVIVVGKLRSLEEQKSVLKLSEKLGWPIFPDVTSGLRLNGWYSNIIHYFDQVLNAQIFKVSEIDGVLHLGGRMTSKRWYDFIETADLKEYIMVLNHPLRNDPLYNVTTRIQAGVRDFCEGVEKQVKRRPSSRFLSSLIKVNQTIHRLMNNYFNDDVLSEPIAARLLTQQLAKNTTLFIGNSLPIREADAFGFPTENILEVGANRGVSGIDGTIATAVGFSRGLQKRTILLIGDLAFLHDLNSLAMLKDLTHPMVIVIFNNNGGGIFSFLPIANSLTTSSQDNGQLSTKTFEKFFTTPHFLTFEAAAKMFHLDYLQPQTQKEFIKEFKMAQTNKNSMIIEIKTDCVQNVRIHQEWQDFLKKSFQEHKSRRCLKIIKSSSRDSDFNLIFRKHRSKG